MIVVIDAFPIDCAVSPTNPNKDEELTWRRSHWQKEFIFHPPRDAPNRSKVISPTMSKFWMFSVKGKLPPHPNKDKEPIWRRIHFQKEFIFHPPRDAPNRSKVISPTMSKFWMFSVKGKGAYGQLVITIHLIPIQFQNGWPCQRKEYLHTSCVVVSASYLREALAVLVCSVQKQVQHGILQ